MAVATRKDLFAFSSRRYRTEKIGGLEFTFQSLTEAEKSNFEKNVLNKAGAVRDDSRRRLLVATLVDADKKPLLSSSDIDSLGDLDGAVTARLFEVAMSHTGFSEDEIESLEKNLPATTAADSRSS